MCHTVGSVDQATAVCPMCKVFKPSGSRCPHLRDVCRNRSLHPRGDDVLYLKNAEVQTFNGCGYCKWARTTSRTTGGYYQNPGWPGCCRPPNAAEKVFVPAADWPTVSLVHHVPIPPDVKALLESITRESMRERVNPAITGGSVRGAPSGVQPTSPSVPRRSSSTVVGQQSKPDSTNPPRAVTLPMAIPSKTRAGGSPQQITASLTARGDGSASSLPNVSASTDQTSVQRERRERPSVEIHTERRRDGSGSRETPTKNSPGRKHAELAGTLSRKSSSHRPSLSAVIAPIPSPKSPEGQLAQPGHRRTQTVSGTSGANISPISKPSTLSRGTAVPVERERERERERNREERGRPSPPRESPREGLPPRESKPSTPSERVPSSGSSTSSGSSGSASDSTVTSDGGFTDYLSDESEAELQRQAETRAALAAQSALEEMEFKAARMQLVGVDLKPPKSWTGNGGGRMQAAYSRG